MLLAAGADAKQRSSKGRIPTDMAPVLMLDVSPTAVGGCFQCIRNFEFPSLSEALEADFFGSHKAVPRLQWSPEWFARQCTGYFFGLRQQRKSKPSLRIEVGVRGCRDVRLTPCRHGSLHKWAEIDDC